MADSRALVLKILGDVSSLNKSMKDAQNSVNGAGMSIEKSFDQVKKAVTVASAAVVGFAVAYGKTAVTAASDLAEEIDKARVVFGSSSAAIEKFGDTAATAIGQSKTQAIAAASNFALFGKSAGLAGEDLVKFSTDFTVLASDLASFNNTTPEEAITALGAALRGETEPIRKYSVLLDDATLRQTALELGIVSTTKNALTPQQKVLAAQAEIFKQTAIQQGNFADTAGGLANQSRILTAQLQTVNAEIGGQLLPYIIQLSTFINDKAVPFIIEYQDAIIKTAFVVTGLATAVLAVNAALKLYNAAIVVATVATTVFNAVIAGNPIGLIVIAVAAVVAAFIRLESQTGMLRKAWEWLTEKIKAALDWFKKVANFFGADFETAAEKHQKTIQRNTEVYDESRRGANQVADSLRQGVAPAMKIVNEESVKLPLVLDNVAAANNRVAASSKVATQQIENQTKASEHLARVRQKLGADPTGAKAVAAARAARAAEAAQLSPFEENRLRNAENLSIADTQALIERVYGGTGTQIAVGGQTFNAAQVNALVGAGLGGLTVGQLGASVSGMGRFSGVTINVNGTVLDPEGVARAIQEVLQNSSARAGALPLTPAGLAFE